MELEVYADPICPWCFIGKRRLDAALGLVAGGDGVSVEWRAFQLNPSMPPEGMERSGYLAAKFGGAARATQVYGVIAREGAAEGIAFAFRRIRRTPNTLDAHRLVRLAAREGRASDMMERLFAAYFLEGRDIGARGELVAVAGEAGFDRDRAAAFLAGNGDRETVLAEDAAARAAGVGGVPHFVIARRIAVPGAQPPEVIARAIELARAGAAAPTPAAGRS
jgi:predicted DsbA family dithiol-disulfide isomerase